MPIVKRSRADLDAKRLRTDMAHRPVPSEAGIARHAVDDKDEWAAPEFAGAAKVYPPPRPREVKALRKRLGLSQAEFARCFGFTLDALQQYEQGRRRPSGPAATLLRVIAREPEAVRRALAV